MPISDNLPCRAVAAALDLLSHMVNMDTYEESVNTVPITDAAGLCIG